MSQPVPERPEHPPRLAASPAGEEEALWAAMAEPSRRRLLDLLLAGGEATPTVLSGQLPISRQAVTKHLAVLEGVGLVSARRQGREVHYRVRPERLDVAARSMAQVAAQWDARLTAIKRLAEEVHREQQRDDASADPRAGRAQPSGGSAAGSGGGPV